MDQGYFLNINTQTKSMQV